MSTEVGILSAAIHVPPTMRTARQIFADEGVEFTARTADSLGIENVPVVDQEKGSHLALRAAEQAIRNAGISAADINVIVDYTVWPQEYLAPAWNMSNKLQHELGATGSFTVGFSGGGTTNFIVALYFAVSLLQSDDTVKGALLVGADTAIPGSRILDHQQPVTVFGDGASAMVLQRGAARGTIVGTEIESEGVCHDMCYIPGGAMAHPDRMDLYRMVLDRERYAATPKWERLRKLVNRLLDRAGIRRKDIAYFLYPNLSLEDQTAFMGAFEIKEDRICVFNRAHYGHLQGNDFVVNYASMVEAGVLIPGDYVLVASHGMGFTWGATLIRY